MPSRARKSAVALALPQPLGLVEQRAALVARARRAGSRSACRARSSSASRARERPRGRSRPRRGRPGSGARRAAAAGSARAARACRGRARSTSRRAASGTGCVSPSTVASSSASTFAMRSWCSRVRLPRKPSHANRQSSTGAPSSRCAVSSRVSSSYALVDLLDVERLLEAREVEVVLLVEVGDEPVGLVAEGVELARCLGVTGP